MPCDSSHMEPNQREQEASQLMCILDELMGNESCEAVPDRWRGHHPAVYNNGIDDYTINALRTTVCFILRDMEMRRGVNMHNFSLELQLWWRDHEKHDRAKQR